MNPLFGKRTKIAETIETSRLYDTFGDLERFSLLASKALNSEQNIDEVFDDLLRKAIWQDFQEEKPGAFLVSMRQFYTENGSHVESEKCSEIVEFYYQNKLELHVLADSYETVCRKYLDPGTRYFSKRGLWNKLSDKRIRGDFGTQYYQHCPICLAYGASKETQETATWLPFDTSSFGEAIARQREELKQTIEPWWKQEQYQTKFAQLQMECREALIEDAADRWLDKYDQDAYSAWHDLYWGSSKLFDTFNLVKPTPSELRELLANYDFKHNSRASLRNAMVVFLSDC